MSRTSRSVISICTIALMLLGTGAQPVILSVHADQTPPSLTAYLVSLNQNPTALSPQNLGTGTGSMVQATAVSVSNLAPDLANVLFSSSAANFHGTGFSATIPLGGYGTVVLQLAGPQGFAPAFCFGFRKNGVSVVDGVPPCGFLSQQYGNAPLGGPGVIVTETLNFAYGGAIPVTVAPTDSLDFSVAFGAVASSGGESITLHYGGGTSLTTSFFQLPIAQPTIPLNMFLTSTQGMPTVLSPSNRGSGVGQALAVPVVQADLNTLANSIFYSPESVVFSGTGFSGVFPQAGKVNFTLQFEGQSGFQPEICLGLRKNGSTVLDGIIFCLSNFETSPLAGLGAIVSERGAFTYTAPQTDVTPSDIVQLSILVGGVGTGAPGQVTLHYAGASQQTTSFFQLPIIAVINPPKPLEVANFWTDSSLNPLPTDSAGNPRVDVVLPNGLVQSTNPGQVLAWTNITNTGSAPLQSLRLNETLPADWAVSPPWIPPSGAIHVYFANSTNLATDMDITQKSTITVSNSNPEEVQLAIPSFNATQMGHPLMPGKSLLLSVKLSYVLIGTIQNTGRYPINYTDTARAVGFSQNSFTGSAVADNGIAFFTAYGKLFEITVNLGRSALYS